MISMNLHQAAAMIGGTLIGKPAQFRGISTDSRQNCSGKLFVALVGENFNGEEYCQAAINNGAIAVLVTSAQDVSTPQLICENSLIALSVLAKNWAKQCQSKIIAITGSNGKTTVKNMIQSILSVSHQSIATQGNLNNEIGVPLTLCNIKASDEYAVIEMGAAKLGDISWLSSLVNIHSAVITNVSTAHIGRFGSFDNIVEEKGKIVSNLNDKSFAILPIEDSNFDLWKSNTKAEIISFGTSDNADINIQTNDGLTLVIANKNITDIKLPVAGFHNQINAGCATAVAESLGINHVDIKIGLENFTAASGRLENLGEIDGNIIINDSYNANPMSVKAAIDVLSQYNGPTTLVFGDMAELGSDSNVLHQQVGEYAKQQNITHLLTIGKDSKRAGIAFSESIQHFNSIDTLKTNMLKNWHQLGTILVKGSRSMHLEDLIEGLRETEKVA